MLSWYWEFQSPLHRGLGSDRGERSNGQKQKSVSIPSSSGPGFGLRWDRSFVLRSKEVSIPSSSGPGFGLFTPTSIRNGCMWVSIPSSSGPGFGRNEMIYTIQNGPLVSIPSSSGPGFGLLPNGPVSGRHTGFNPLFIGAWVRTWKDFHRRTNRKGFNPLFIGAWVRTKIRLKKGSHPNRFNPLFIGAWVRTTCASAHQFAHAMFQSPLHRGLGSDSHLLEAVDVPPDGK